jgi:trehalose 6-phosphate phosphatase
MNSFLKERIQELVARRSETAFFVDFDGTMVDLVPHPNKIDVPPELIHDLRAIAFSCECIFTIVTGRPLSQLKHFLPGVALSCIGCHGVEICLRAGEPIKFLAPPMPEVLRETLRNISEQNACFFEDKEYSVSLHLPFTHINDDLMPELKDALGKSEIDYICRKVGRTYEIIQRGQTKGSAIEYFMKYPKFNKRKPVYIGDDVCVDDSLEVVSRLGGDTIFVGDLQDKVLDTDCSEDYFSVDSVRLLLALLGKEM